ncbi:MAG: SH3 domain-containing protein [Treponema sp.]|nr:SH3 domain-containing protein [Treponema sp.]
MEKQGMDRRKRFLRTGLLISLLIFLARGFLFSQADEGVTSPAPSGAESAGAEAPQAPAQAASNVLEIRTDSSPANPAVNSPWSLFILVNHPWPQEVTVTPPRFPPSLVLERVRTETRTIQGDRWTRVEFLFTPLKTGLTALGSFAVTTPDKRGETGAINVRFREEPRTGKRYDPKFRWVSPVPSVPPGERGELSLDLTNWDPQKPPPDGIFRGRTPRDAIMEEKKPLAAGQGSYRYTISLIPIQGSSVTLEPFTFQAQGFTLSVPGITVPVLPARPSGSAAQPPQPGGATQIKNAAADKQAEGIPAYPFPQSREKVFPLFRGDYNRIITGVKTLWDKGQRVEALAEIRRNERDSLSGPYLASLRRGMEQTMRLSFTDDEKWRPLKIPLLSWVILGFLVIAAASVLLVFYPLKKSKKKEGAWNSVQWDESSGSKGSGEPVTSRRRSGFLSVIVFVLSVGLAVIILEEGLGNFMLNRLSPSGTAAVLEKTPAYRVPDDGGAVNTWFDEGQPVTAGDCQGAWCYVESPDGRSGWVKRDAVVSY